VPAGPQPNAPGDLIDQARQAAINAGIDPEIFTRQIQQESNFNPNAKSPAGALGIAQFMPATAQGLGIDPMNAAQSLVGAAQEDARRLQQYGGDWAKTLASYNAGPGAVAQYGGVPPYQETQDYVRNILGGAQNVIQQGAQAVQGAAQNVIQAGQQAVSNVKQAVTGQPDTSGMVFPVVGYKGDVNLHWGDVTGGSDIMADRGTPVVAMEGGKVVESGYNKVGGNSVLIQGDDGNQYYYAHFDQAPSVKVGDTINAGTFLGPVGNTGDASNGPTHLHIGIGPSILLGADKYGGTGGDYDAVGLLRAVLSGSQGSGQATNTAAAGPQAIAPPSPSPSTANQPVYMSTLEPATNSNPLDLLAQASSAVQSKAQDTVNAVLGLGGQVSNPAQDLLSQAMQTTQPAVSTVQDLLGRSPQIQPMGGGLADIGAGAQNMLSQAAQNPTVQDAARNILLPMLGLPNTPVPSVNALFDALNPAVTPQPPLGRAADWLSQQNVPLLSGAAGVSAPMLNQGGALDASFLADNLANQYGTYDSSQYSPADQQRLAQASMAIGGLVSPLDLAAGPAGAAAAPAAAASTLGPVTWGQRARALQMGVISDPATAVKVALSSIINPVWSGTTRTAADLLGATPLGQLPFVDITPTEALGRIQGRALGAGSGLADAGGALARGFSHVWNDPDSIAARATNPIDQIFGQVTQTSAAIHSAFQSAGQEILTQMEYQAAAGEDAVRRGFQPGTSEFVNEVARMVANPNPQLLSDAQQLAARAVGRGDLGTLGRGFANLAGQGPGTAGYGQYSLGNALFPVFRTGYNLLTQGVEKSPLGLGGTAFDVLRATTPLGRIVGEGPYAGGAFQRPVGQMVGGRLTQPVAPLAERFTNNVFGTALTAWLATQAAQGNITGDGPADPGERAVWTADGHQPHAVQMPGVGWVSYQGTPYETQLGLAGDYADAMSMPMSQTELQQPYVDTVAERLGGAVLNSLASRTGMETMGQISDLLHGLATDAPTAVNQLAMGLGGNLLGSYVPMSGLLRGVERGTDPYLRQALPPAASVGLAGLPGAIGQSVAEGIPGLAQNVPARVDVLGRPMTNPQQGLAALLPIRQTPGQPSSVLDALQYAGVGVSAPPKTINYGPYDQITLTPQQQQVWQQLRGQQLQAALGGLQGPFQPTDKKNLQFAVNLADRIATNVANLQILGAVQRDPNSAAPIPRPGSLTAPAQSYTPGVFSLDPMAAIIGNQTGLQALQTQAAESQHLRRQAESRALLSSLVGG
jgi:murein DD-endopeptidase MepM/ murein hydrolase activator NlpD